MGLPGLGNMEDCSAHADSGYLVIILGIDFIHSFILDIAVGAFKLNKISCRDISPDGFGRAVFALKFICCIRTPGFMYKLDNFSCRGPVEPEEFVHFSFRNRRSDNVDEYFCHIDKACCAT